MSKERDITISTPVLYNGLPTQVISGPKPMGPGGAMVVLLAYVGYPVPIDSEKLQIMEQYSQPTPEQETEHYQRHCNWHKGRKTETVK